jgi:hypothetical protein
MNIYNETDTRNSQGTRQLEPGENIKEIDI